MLLGMLPLAAPPRTFAQAEAAKPAPEMPETVGPHGDPRTFEFVGQERFQSDEFVGGLRYSLDFQLAAEGDRPMTAFLERIEELMMLGFRHSGHPDAKVTASWDSNTERIVVRIKEGSRFVNGDVVVTGGTTLDTEAFRMLLLSTNKVAAGRLVGVATDEETEDIGPIWKPGKATRFDAFTAYLNRRLITNLLALAGHPFARASHELVRRDDGTCNMRVTILDEGPRPTIGKIKIENATKNSPEKILEQLGFKTGDPYHTGMDDVIRQRLIDGGRFIDYRLETTPPNDDGMVDLTIAVRELMSAPPLGEELNDVQQILLKCRRWLESPDRSDTDIEGRFVDAKTDRLLARMIISDRGFFGEAGKMDGFLGTELLVTGSNLVFAVPELDQSVAFPVTGSITVSFSAGATEDWSGPNMFNIHVGAGMSANEEGDATVKLNTSLLPAVFLRLAEVSTTGPRLDETRLFLEEDTFSIEVDRITGRLIRLTVTDKRGRLEITTGRGLLEAARDSVTTGTGSLRNLVTSERPILSSIAGVVRLLLAQPVLRTSISKQLGDTDKAVKLMDAIQVLNWETISEPLTQLTFFPDNGTNEFNLPPVSHAPESDAQLGNSAYGVAITALSNDLFAPNSGLWLFSRGMGFHLAGKGASGLERFLDSDGAKNLPEAGPLAYWMISRIATETGLIDEIAMETAKTGYRLLSPKQFRDEVSALLTDDRAFSRSVQQLGYAIAGDSDEDIEKIANGLGPHGSRFVRDTAAAIRAKGDQPLADVWLPFWERLYRDALEEMLEEDLFKLMSPRAK